MDHFTKYYGALRAIEIRFPVSSDNSHVNISFKWHDAFRDKQTCTQKNIHFEKAAVLFCMAAIASQKGLDISRKTEAGITEAVKTFALSAGAHSAALGNYLVPICYNPCCGRCKHQQAPVACNHFYPGMHKRVKLRILI